MDAYYTKTADPQLISSLSSVGFLPSQITNIQNNFPQVWAALEDLIYNAPSAITKSEIPGLNTALQAAASTNNWGAVALAMDSNLKSDVRDRRLQESELMLGFNPFVKPNPTPISSSSVDVQSLITDVKDAVQQVLKPYQYATTQSLYENYLMSQGYYVPQSTSPIWNNVATVVNKNNNINISGAELKNLNAQLQGSSLTTGGLVYVPIKAAVASSPVNIVTLSPNDSHVVYLYDQTTNSVYTMGASLKSSSSPNTNLGDVYVINTNGNTLMDTVSQATLSYASNDITLNVSGSNSVTITDKKGTVTDTDSITATAAQLSSDTYSFEGNSIAGTIVSSQKDKYGRTYLLSGTTLTITGSTSGDSLTINNFQNGDFGVNISEGYTYTDVIYPGAVNNYTAIAAVSNLGLLAGVYGTTYNANTGYYASFEGMPNNLSTINSPIVGFPQSGINDKGQIVGVYSASVSSSGIGFLYSNGGYTTYTPQSLGFGANYTSDIMDGINNAGNIIGYVASNSNEEGFLYASGNTTVINFSGEQYTSVIGINNSDQIVGNASSAPVQYPSALAGDISAFMYSGGTYTPIIFKGSDPGSTVVYGINDSGVVVGSYAQAGVVNYFLYQNGNYSQINLRNLGTTYVGITGIDGKGQIVGSHINQNNQMVGFIATPTVSTSSANSQFSQLVQNMASFGANSNGAMIAVANENEVANPVVLTAAHA